MYKVEIKKEVLDFLRMQSHLMIDHQTGIEFIFMPIWFRSTDEEGVYEAYNLNQDNLPEDLKEFIQSQRDRFQQIEDIHQFPLTEKDCYDNGDT